MPRDPAQKMRRSRWAPPPPVAHPPTRGLCRLTFTLPPTLALLAPSGRHCPCLMGCLVTVGRNGYVVVDGTCRENVFEQAARYLRSLLRELKHAGNVPPPQVIAGSLQTAYPLQPRPEYAGEDLPRGGRDTVHLAIGAEVVCSMGGIEPWVAAREAEPAA